MENAWSLVRSRQVAIAVIAIVAGATAGLAQAPASDASSASVIVTQGIATLKRAPDRAWVSIAVEAREGKAADARRKAATQMTAVQTAVKAIGLPADAIKTTGFSLQPQMEWDAGRMRTREYAVRNQIDVRVDDLDLIGDVLDAAGSVKTSGALSVSVTGMRFDLKDRENAERETLRLAVADATARASAMAAGSGRTLGAIIRLEEQRLVEQPKPLTVQLRESARANSGLALELPGASQAAAGGGGQRGGGSAAGGGVPIDTPIAPNEIELKTMVSLTVALR